MQGYNINQILKLTIDTPYLALTCKLCDTHREYFGNIEHVLSRCDCGIYPYLSSAQFLIYCITMGSLKHVADLLLNILDTAFKTAAVQCKQFPVFFAGGSVGVIPSNHLVHNRRIGAKLDLQVENDTSQNSDGCCIAVFTVTHWPLGDVAVIIKL